MLEREIDDAVVGRDEVARHLQCESCLAQTWRSAQKRQLTRAEPTGQRHIQGRETGRPDLSSSVLIHIQPAISLLHHGVQRLQPICPHEYIAARRQVPMLGFGPDHRTADSDLHRRQGPSTDAPVATLTIITALRRRTLRMCAEMTVCRRLSEQAAYRRCV